MTNTLNKIIKTSLSLSLISMAGMVISPALNDIGNYFSNIPSVYIQMLITIPSIFMIPATLMSSKVKEYLTYKQIYLTCLIVLLISGIIPIFFKNFYFILISRIFIGLSIGLLTPINTSMITTNLSNEIKTKVLGFNTAMESLGGTIMVYFSAFLASISWELCFYVYLISLIPIYFVVFKFNDNFHTQKDHHQVILLNKDIIIYTIILCLYMTFLNVFSTNISLLIYEKNIGSTILSGNIVAIYLLSGFFCGLLFEKMNHIFKKYTFLIGILLSGIGLVILSLSNSIFLLILGSIISGYGMGQAIPASINKVSQIVCKENQTFSISLILSGSRVGQFFTTLIYLPIVHLFTMNTSFIFSVSGICLVILCIFIWLQGR